MRTSVRSGTSLKMLLFSAALTSVSSLTSTSSDSTRSSASSTCVRTASRAASVNSCSRVGKCRYTVRRDTSAAAATALTDGVSPRRIIASAAARISRRVLRF